MNLVRDEITGSGDVARIRKIKTMHLGPHEILLVAKVEKEKNSERDVPELTTEIRRRIQSAFPDIREVYLDFGEETKS
jgi:hypothetical protein